MMFGVLDSETDEAVRKVLAAAECQRQIEEMHATVQWDGNICVVTIPLIPYKGGKPYTDLRLRFEATSLQEAVQRAYDEWKERKETT